MQTEILKKLIKTSYLINGAKRAYFLNIVDWLPKEMVEKLIQVLEEEKRIQIKIDKTYQDKLKILFNNSNHNLMKNANRQLKKIEGNVNIQEFSSLDNLFNQL